MVPMVKMQEDIPIPFENPVIYYNVLKNVFVWKGDRTGEQFSVIGRIYLYKAACHLLFLKRNKKKESKKH